MKRGIWAAVILLALLHQDFWLWNDASLVWGFIPVGLAYHMLYSVLAGILWGLAAVYAWPETVETEPPPTSS